MIKNKFVIPEGRLSSNQVGETALIVVAGNVCVPFCFSHYQNVPYISFKRYHEAASLLMRNSTPPL